FLSIDLPAIASMPFFLFVSSFFDAKLGDEKLAEKMLMPGRLRIMCTFEIQNKIVRFLGG
ncbi:MAG: hypothetical protein K0B15_17215, partial [Lentimicrobium sp.]|nr:hypothetical protein [Lentimicrobium sp.]